MILRGIILTYHISILSFSVISRPSHPDYAVAYTVHHGNANPLNSTQVLSSEGPSLLSLPISPSAYNLAPGSPAPDNGFSSSSSSSVTSPEIGPADSKRSTRISFSSRTGFPLLQIPTDQTGNSSLFSPGSGGSLSDNPNVQRDLERKGLLNAAVRALASLKDVHGNRACIHLCTESAWLVRIVKEEVPRWEKEGWPDVKKYDLVDVDEGLNLNESDEITNEKPPTPITDSGVALAKALNRREEAAKRREASEESSKDGFLPRSSAAQRLAQAVTAGNPVTTSPTSTAASSPHRTSIPLHESVRRNSTLGNKSIQSKSAPRRSSILSTAPSTYSLSSSMRSISTPQERDAALLESLGSDFVLLRSLIQLIDSLSLRTNHTGGFRIYLIEGSKNPAREKSRERAKVEAEEREYKRKGQASTLKKPRAFEDSKSIKSRDSMSRSRSEINLVSTVRSPSVKSKTRSMRSPLLGQEKSSRSSIAEKAVAPRLRTYSSKSGMSSGGAPIVHRNSSLAPPLPLSTSGLLIRSDSRRSEKSSRSNLTERKASNQQQVADVPKDLDETDPLEIKRPVSVQRTRSGASYQSARSGRTAREEELETPPLENDDLQDEEVDGIRSPVTPLEKGKVKFPKLSKGNQFKGNGNGGILKKAKSQPQEEETFKKEKKGLFGGMFGSWRIMA